MEDANVVIANRACFLARHLSNSGLRSITLVILYDLGMPLNCYGFDYLKAAIAVAYSNHTQIVVKEIYDAVRLQYDAQTDVTSVEQAIRSLIGKAWQCRREYRWEWYFPASVTGKRTPPSNLEFISGIVYFLEMWHECNEEAGYERV